MADLGYYLVPFQYCQVSPPVHCVIIIFCINKYLIQDLLLHAHNIMEGLDSSVAISVPLHALNLCSALWNLMESTRCESMMMAMNFQITPQGLFCSAHSCP